MPGFAPLRSGTFSDQEGHSFCFVIGMELFDVKAPGIRSPLNSREISHLVRTGYLPPDTACKPKGVTGWGTIDELFPSLRWRMDGYILPPDKSQPAAHRTSRLFVSILAVAVTAIAAFFLRDRFIHDSVDATPPPSSSQRSTAPMIVARGD